MANRKLPPKEITQLVELSVQQSDAIDQRRAWPGHRNLKALAQAVKERRPFVTMDNGGKQTRFSIRYSTHFGGTVFVKPDNESLRPCGYFNIAKLEDALVGLE